MFRYKYFLKTQHADIFFARVAVKGILLQREKDLNLGKKEVDS